MQMIIMAQDRPPHYKGDIVEMRASGTSLPGPTSPYVVAEILNTPLDNYLTYHAAWKREVDFEVVSHDEAADVYQLRLYSTTANAGQGEITKDDVEAYIQSWNGVIDSWGANEVYWTISIYDALTSQAFWEMDISQVVFSEISYDQTTGVHRVQADYSVIAPNPTSVERHVSRMGLTIISHGDRVLTYDADSSTCAAILKRQLQGYTRKIVARRRYHIAESVVDTIINNGGYMAVDESTMLNYVKDKASE